MFWEIADDIRRKVTMTVIPALRNLFSSKKSLAGMFLVMLVLQILLGVVCISGIENIKNQQVVLKEFRQMIAPTEVEQTDVPQSNTADVSDTDTEYTEPVTENELVSADTLSTALSSTSIFIGAVLIWGVCAVTVYQKVTFAAADRDKYLWGMYITHGAKIKKIRSMLKCELYLPHLAATAVAYPLAVVLYAKALGQGEYVHSIITLIVILVLSYLCIRLVVEYECLLIRRMTCTEMLREEDSPKSVCFPRRHSRLIRGYSMPTYALNTFIRMRKYYISLAAIAAIPAVIWSCFHVSAISQDYYLASDIGEFTLTAKNSISQKDIDRILNDDLLSINGVSRATTSAYYNANKIYTHILTDKDNYKNTELTPYLTTTYADNSLVMCCADRVFKQTTGYNISSVSRGKVKILAPAGGTQYNFSEGEEIRIAISKLDGSIRVVEDASTALREDMSAEWEYKIFTVESYSTANPQYLSSTGFLNVQKTYFIFNKDDYKKITSVDTDQNQQDINTQSLSVATELDGNGSFNVTLNTALLKKIPSVGDCFSLDGAYSLNIRLTETVGKETQTWDVKTDGEFDYAYINSVSVTGDRITLNVSPCAFVTVEAPSAYSKGRYVALGTPTLDSTGLVYCPATSGEALELYGGTVTITSSYITLYTSSEITACEAGIHALLSEKNLVNTEGRLMLEQLYADNSFVIAYNDNTTRDTLGLDVSDTKDGQAVLVLPSLAYHNYNMSVGDKIRFAITLAEVTECSSESITAYGDYDTLKIHIRSKHDYVSCRIVEIVYSTEVTKPHFLVSNKDFSSIINKTSPYVTINVFLNADMDSANYTDVRSELNLWATGTGFRYGTSVTSTGEYLEHLLRKNANYSTLIMLISSLIPLIVPFIWYYPLTSLFERRKTEFAVLYSMGKRKRQIRGSILLEGVLVSICAFATVFIAVFPAMVVFKLICTTCKLPLAFEYSHLSLSVLVSAAAFSAACAAVSFVVGYVVTSPKTKKHHRRRKYGNT